MELTETLKKTISYGVGAITVGAFIGSVAFTIALTVSPYEAPVISPKPLEVYRWSQEKELVYRHEGQPDLDKILKSQPLQINHNVRLFNPNVVTVDHQAALENSCGLEQFVDSSVCRDYEEVQERIEAQARINAKYEWLKPASYLSTALSVAGFVAMGVAYKVAKVPAFFTYFVNRNKK